MTTKAIEIKVGDKVNFKAGKAIIARDLTVTLIFEAKGATNIVAIGKSGRYDGKASSFAKA